MAGSTTIQGSDASGNAVGLLAGSDGTNVSPGHTLYDVTGQAVGTNNPLAVSAQLPVTPLTDHSGTITAANTAQQLLAPNAARNGFFLIGSADFWISMTKAAVALNGGGSQKIPAGSLWESPPRLRPIGAVSIISTISGATFTVQEW